MHDLYYYAMQNSPMVPWSPWSYSFRKELIWAVSVIYVCRGEELGHGIPWDLGEMKKSRTKRLFTFEEGRVK
jgi:hypothetical protein